MLLCHVPSRRNPSTVDQLGPSAPLSDACRRSSTVRASGGWRSGFPIAAGAQSQRSPERVSCRARSCQRVRRPPLVGAPSAAHAFTQPQTNSHAARQEDARQEVGEEAEVDRQEEEVEEKRQRRGDSRDAGEGRSQRRCWCTTGTCPTATTRRGGSWGTCNRAVSEEEEEEEGCRGSRARWRSGSSA